MRFEIRHQHGQSFSHFGDHILVLLEGRQGDRGEFGFGRHRGRRRREDYAEGGLDLKNLTTDI